MSDAAALREGRRTALILAATQAIVGSASPICFSLGALAGHHLLGEDKSLATAPVTAFTLGVALGAAPAASLVRRLGQRNGFQLGTFGTGLGGLLCAAALFQSSFWLFAAGMLIVGLGGAFVQQFRFAAADNAPPEFKAKAIAFVLAGGIFTAVISPQVVIHTRELLAPVMFAGSFLSIVGLAVIGAALLFLLRRRSAASARALRADEHARPLGAILSQPRFATGLLCAVGSYALMSFVMTGAPLAMVGCGFTPDDAALGISWHVMAMFGPSFFTGSLIARFGQERIVALGLLLLVGCAVVALSGIALWQFWAALVLLGLGWNFAFIGSTAMVAGTYRASETGKVQGFHDSVLFGFVAVASLMSGIVYNGWGWDMLNWVVFPISALCLLSLAWLAGQTRRTAAAR